MKIFSKSILVAMQAQFSVGLGMLFSLLFSLFYYFKQDARFPQEEPWILFLGASLSFFLCFCAFKLSKKFEIETSLNLKEASFAIVFAWFLATMLSALVFLLAGFPDPVNTFDYTFLRRLIDSIYESVSGYTTAGGSILPSVEVFPRGILMWRSTTHFLGGMGMAFMAITLMKAFRFKRESLINAEAEGPNNVEFSNEKDARLAGFDFLKIYGFLTFILFVLLFVVGVTHRSTPYVTWYDNAFDAVNHSFSVMGTGGFGVYDSSAGLPITEQGEQIIGGLRNPLAEWILAIFMFIAGSNLALWYVLFFKKNIKLLIKDKEFQAYLIYVFSITIGIWLVLELHNLYPFWDALRYAFFNVVTIVSTTGLATADFTVWPAAAEGLLLICYLVGGMLGSTAGGLKVARFLILYRYTIVKIKNLINGTHQKHFMVNGTMYDLNSAGTVVVNAILYYMIFLGGAVLIMITSPVVRFVDGTVSTVDFTSAVGASIANLGNIGPAIEIGNINAGPAGNYYAFSGISKLIMAGLMIIGRLGVLTIIMLFISHRGERFVKDSVIDQHFDSDTPHLFKS